MEKKKKEYIQGCIIKLVEFFVDNIKLRFSWRERRRS